MNRKIVARFPTLLEAEAAVTALEASEIDALIDNGVAGSMMPHGSNALGGFIVSVNANRDKDAREILKGLSGPEILVAEAPTEAHQVSVMMKRAAYGAVLGCVFLPVIANLFSLAMYFRAYRKSSKEFLNHLPLFIIGMIFNIIAISAIFLIFGMAGKLLTY